MNARPFYLGIATDNNSEKTSIIKNEKPKARDQLISINMQHLAENRHATHYCDIADIYVATGEIETAKDYALLAVNKAVETHRLDVLPEDKDLSQAIRKKDHHNPHATAIAEYVEENTRQA